MQGIASLRAGAGETDIAQVLLRRPGVNPKTENALLSLPKLSGTGEHSTAIHPDGKIEGRAVLESENLRGRLGAAIQGEGRGRGETFGNSLGGCTRRHGVR